MRRRWATHALIVAAVGIVAATLASPASAHPLGNFTTNQLVQLRFDEGSVRVDYVLDQAEIPTFQAVQRFDADGDGAIAGAELEPLLDSILDEVASGLQLVVDGRPVPLGQPRETRLSFPPGQGGLELTRLEASFTAQRPTGATEVGFANRAYSARTGWTAIQVLPGTGTDVDSSVAATDATDRLRRYPEDLLSSPPNEREASFSLRAGSGQVAAPEGLSGGKATQDRSLDGFADALAGGDTQGLLILFLLAAAFGWGALHALSPGHGKAMVAGYLVGARGTPRHAAILGLTVTATHTVSVFALGFVTLAASQYILPEDLYPLLAVASGLLVVGIGIAVMRSRFRRWRAMRAISTGTELGAEPGHRSHSGADGLSPHDGHAHQGHSHDHGHAAEGQSRDGHPPHGHSHLPDGPITMRGLVGLGVSGGMVPCPSALVVLVAAISQHRIGLGMILIVVFSIGLAASMTAIGLAVIYGGRLIRRLRPERRLFGSRIAGAIPALSASVIVIAGVLITVRSLPELGL